MSLVDALPMAAAAAARLEPAIVVDGRYAWAGSVPEPAFVERVLSTAGD